MFGIEKLFCCRYRGYIGKNKTLWQNHYYINQEKHNVKNPKTVTTRPTLPCIYIYIYIYICQNDWTKPGYRLTIRARITAKALYFATHESKHSTRQGPVSPLWGSSDIRNVNETSAVIATRDACYNVKII